MQRRNVIKNLAIGLGGLISMPVWANQWDKNRLGVSNILSHSQDVLLAEVVETIIPETNTFGAKSLGVDKLIQKIVSDCYGKEAETKLASGLNAIDALAKNSMGVGFVDLDVAQRLEVLKSIETSEDSELKATMKQLKRMTIDGYMKSEYVMTKMTDYEFAPGRYLGCVPAKS